MSVRKVLGWAIAIFVVYFLATEPAAADHAVRSVLGVLQSAAHSMSTFITGI